MKDFHNKVAAITGAGSGMGRCLAIQLAQSGCHVAISDCNEAGLAQTAAEVRAWRPWCRSPVIAWMSRIAPPSMPGRMTWRARMAA
jgi:NAD(P)-dependent dehydrogenase (short-subunit alcohol dehydrogenase family)